MGRMKFKVGDKVKPVETYYGLIKGREYTVSKVCKRSIASSKPGERYYISVKELTLIDAFFEKRLKLAEDKAIVPPFFIGQEVVANPGCGNGLEEGGKYIVKSSDKSSANNTSKGYQWMIGLEDAATKEHAGRVFECKLSAAPPSEHAVIDIVVTDVDGNVHEIHTYNCHAESTSQVEQRFWSFVTRYATDKSFHDYDINLKLWVEGIQRQDITVGYI